MKDFFLKYIDYLKEKARLKYYRCPHEWEKIDEGKFWNKLNPDLKWIEFTYRCVKCCEYKRISTQDY